MLKSVFQFLHDHATEIVVGLIVTGLVGLWSFFTKRGRAFLGWLKKPLVGIFGRQGWVGRWYTARLKNELETLKSQAVGATAESLGKFFGHGCAALLEAVSNYLTYQRVPATAIDDYKQLKEQSRTLWRDEPKLEDCWSRFAYDENRKWSAVIKAINDARVFLPPKVKDICDRRKLDELSNLSTSLPEKYEPNYNKFRGDNFINVVAVEKLKQRKQKCEDIQDALSQLLSDVAGSIPKAGDDPLLAQFVNKK